MKINLKDVYNDGFRHGLDLITYNIHEIEVKHFNADEINEFKERAREICWEADENYRQYTPFEFFCKEMNDAENSEEAWDAYERGIGDGIETELDAFCKELDFEETD